VLLITCQKAYMSGCAVWLRFSKCRPSCTRRRSRAFRTQQGLWWTAF